MEKGKEEILEDGGFTMDFSIDIIDISDDQPAPDANTFTVESLVENMMRESAHGNFEQASQIWDKFLAQHSSIFAVSAERLRCLQEQGHRDGIVEFADYLDQVTLTERQRSIVAVFRTIAVRPGPIDHEDLAIGMAILEFIMHVDTRQLLDEQPDEEAEQLLSATLHLKKWYFSHQLAEPHSPMLQLGPPSHLNLFHLTERLIHNQHFSTAEVLLCICCHPRASKEEPRGMEDVIHPWPTKRLHGLATLIEDISQDDESCRIARLSLARIMCRTLMSLRPIDHETFRIHPHAEGINEIIRRMTRLLSEALISSDSPLLDFGPRIVNEYGLLILEERAMASLHSHGIPFTSSDLDELTRIERLASSYADYDTVRSAQSKQQEVLAHKTKRRYVVAAYSHVSKASKSTHGLVDLYLEPLPDDMPLPEPLANANVAGSRAEQTAVRVMNEVLERDAESRAPVKKLTRDFPSLSKTYDIPRLASLGPLFSNARRQFAVQYESLQIRLASLARDFDRTDDMDQKNRDLVLQHLHELERLLYEMEDHMRRYEAMGHSGDKFSRFTKKVRWSLIDREKVERILSTAQTLTLSLETLLASFKAHSEQAVRADLEAPDINATTLYATEIHATEIHATKIFATEIHSAKLQTQELHSPQVYSAELQSEDIHAAKIYSSNIQAQEVHCPEIYSTTLRSEETHSTEIYSTRLEAREIYTKELSAQHVHSSDPQAEVEDSEQGLDEQKGYRWLIPPVHTESIRHSRDFAKAGLSQKPPGYTGKTVSEKKEGLDKDNQYRKPSDDRWRGEKSSLKKMVQDYEASNPKGVEDEKGKGYWRKMLSSKTDSAPNTRRSDYPEIPGEDLRSLSPYPREIS